MVWEAGGISAGTRPGRHVANRGKRGEIFIIIYWPATQGGASLGQDSLVVPPRPRYVIARFCAHVKVLAIVKRGVMITWTRSVAAERSIADCNLDSRGLGSSHDRRTDNSHSA